ncbi:MAG: histidine phosphatase family protein [Promethearchaeota archaeon]
MNTLKTVSWGKGALSLLAKLKNGNLIKKVPTILMLRHSEREEPEILEEIFNAPLTERGRKAAYEFGNNLPRKYNYHFFHSPVERCKNTAEEIRRGLSNTDSAFSIEPLESLYKVVCDYEKFKTNLKRTQMKFLDYWIGNFYDPNEIEPALAVAERMAEDLRKIIKNQDGNTINVFVSHDFHVILAQFFWTGILATNEWIQYLDGFIMQFLDDKMIFYSKNETREVSYPYWWK